MPVHIAITRRVRAGAEAEFQRELREFLRASFAHSAVIGASMLVPPPGSDSRDYGILRTFRNHEERDAFYASELFRTWEARAAQLTEGPPEYRELSGLEAWFRAPVPPPRWKMAIVTYVGVNGITLVLALVVNPWIQSLPLVLANAIFNLLVVSGLTWLVMPPLTRFLHRWLHS